MRNLLFRCVVAWAVSGAGVAHAYDSRCYLADGSACAEGAQAARGRWVGPSDEHRQLFVAGMERAGLPMELNAPLDLTIFTSGRVVLVGEGPAPSLIPASLGDVGDVQRRVTTAAEFAQLPDFGYALYDWALGLETCPVDNVDAETCHLFAGHMGALNSNHFLPQAQVFYRYYHELALVRAAECRTMSTALGAEATRFVNFVQDCEKEAMLLEAIGQHYLQDAWSSGHMWARWGSPDRAAFPSLLRGVAVAATAGLIHGARALLQPDLTELLIDVPDAMCAPQLEVEWQHPDEGRHAGVGDLFIDELTGDGRFDKQRARLFSCAVAGVRSVYAATGQQHGALQPPTGDGLISVDPVSDACFGQRATNRALNRGFGIDLVLGGVPEHIVMTPALVGSVVLAGTSARDPNEAALLGAQFAFDLVLLSARLEFHGKMDPFGTDMAAGGIGPLVGIEANPAYVTSPPAPYLDPALPWSPAPRATDATPAAALARTFHRGHAASWCAAFAAEPAALEALRERVSTLTDAIEVATPGSELHTGLVKAKDAQCASCAEFAARHLRIGTGPDDFDATREPLCVALGSTAPVVYAAGATEGAAVRGWCGCSAPDVALTLRSINPTRPGGQTSVCADVTRDGGPAEGLEVFFSLVEGGGTLSPSVVRTGADGAACTDFTAGASDGLFPVRAALAPTFGEVEDRRDVRVASSALSARGTYRGNMACNVFDIRLPLANRDYMCGAQSYTLSISGAVVNGESGVDFTIISSSTDCGIPLRHPSAVSGFIDASRHEFAIETFEDFGVRIASSLSGAVTASPAQLMLLNRRTESNSQDVLQLRYDCTFIADRIGD